MPRTRPVLGVRPASRRASQPVAGGTLPDGVGATGSGAGGAVVVVGAGVVELEDEVVGGTGVLVGGGVLGLDEVVDEPVDEAPPVLGVDVRVGLVVRPADALVVLEVVVVELVEVSGTGRSLARPPEATRNATSSSAARPCRLKKSTQSDTAVT